MSKRTRREALATSSGEPARLVGRILSAAEETSLLDRLVARDEQALVKLIDLATPWLLGLTLSMLRDPDDAEDVVQEAFTIVWNRIELVDQHHSLIPWLLSVARNRAIDRLRSGRRASARLARLEAHRMESAATVAAPEANEAALPGWHIHESVHAAIETLPDDQRDVVILAYFRGLTHSEIAGHLGLPLGTIKTRIRLAFDKLRVALAPIKDWVP
jgi:RNA polymerase sigma-70 factor (ECF subfamily)